MFGERQVQECRLAAAKEAEVVKQQMEAWERVLRHRVGYRYRSIGYMILYRYLL